MDSFRVEILDLTMVSCGGGLKRESWRATSLLFNQLIYEFCCQEAYRNIEGIFA